MGSIKRVVYKMHSNLGHSAVRVRAYQLVFWVSNDATLLGRLMTSSAMRGMLAMTSEHHHVLDRNVQVIMFPWYRPSIDP